MTSTQLIIWMVYWQLGVCEVFLFLFLYYTHERGECYYGQAPFFCQIIRTQAYTKLYFLNFKKLQSIVKIFLLNLTNVLKNGNNIFASHNNFLFKKKIWRYICFFSQQWLGYIGHFTHFLMDLTKVFNLSEKVKVDWVDCNFLKFEKNWNLIISLRG